MERLDQRYRQVALTVTAELYTTGDCVGGLKTISNNLLPQMAKSGEVRQVLIADKAGNAVDYDVVFFHTEPSTSTLTDGAAADIAAADLSKICGVVEVRSSYAFADNGICSSGPTAIPINETTTTLYFAVIARGGPTYASTSDVTVGLYVYGD